MKNLLVLAVMAVVCFGAYKALRHPGLLYGHDAESVLFRSMEFRQALRDGHFPVRWSKRLDHGMGQPTFVFVYNLPYYISAGLGQLGMSEVWAYKIILAVSFPVSAWFAYLWLKQWFGTGPAIMGGLFYTYVPYHFLNVYVRAAFGEVVAATMVPLVFYTVTQLVKQTKIANMALVAISVGLLALAHHMYVVILLPLLVGYVGLLQIKKVPWLLVGIVMGLGMASYYLVPALAYKNLTHLSEVDSWFWENNNFLTYADWFVPRWGFSALRQNSGEGLMSVQIGWPQVLVLAVAGGMCLANKTRVPKKMLMYMWVVVAGALFMMTQQSAGVWKILPLVRNLQFPWRLMFVVNIGCAWWAALVASYVKRQWWVVGGGLLLVANYGYWHVYRYYDWVDPTPKTIGYPGTLTMLQEERPLWHTKNEEYNPYEMARVAQGSGSLTPHEWKTNYQSMAIDCPQDCTVSFRTHAWPGWEVTVDDKQVELFDPYSETAHGLVTFAVPAGQHQAVARLKETSLEKTADWITIVSLIMVGYLLTGLVDKTIKLGAEKTEVK